MDGSQSQTFASLYETSPVTAVAQEVRGILVVEDDEDIRESIAEVLDIAGYRTLVAANGREALATLRTKPHPALILLDLTMPIMSGWEFRAAQLGDPLLARIPVVLLSAVASPERRVIELRANAFLRKPVSLERLLAVVGDVGLRPT